MAPTSIFMPRQVTGDYVFLTADALFECAFCVILNTL
jgi:hypothetical protein